MTITNFATGMVVAASLAYTTLNYMTLEDNLNLANNSDDKRAFLQFAATNNKHYKTSEEMATRFGHWRNTKEFIQSAKAADPTAPVGFNLFSDWSREEFEAISGTIALDDSTHRQLARGGKGGGGGGSDGSDGGSTTDPCVGTGCNPKKCGSCDCSADGLYTNNRGACVECSATFGAQCTSCTSSGCSACASGYDLVGGQCVVDCPSGQYFNSSTGSCQNCDISCAECSSFSYCTACKQNANFQTSPSNGTCSCVQGYAYNTGTCNACSSDQYWVSSGQGSCATCDSRCATCSNSTSCDSCAKSYLNLANDCQCPSGQIDNGSACVEYTDTCPFGQYDNGSNCVSCDETCSDCSSSATSCTACPNNTVLQGSTCGCPSGQTMTRTITSLTSTTETASYQCVVPATSSSVHGSYPSSATSVDWRDKGVVAPVQNQGGCGSCWCFSTSAVAESLYAIKYGMLYNTSEQYLLDCVPDSLNFYCQGGYQHAALQFIADEGIPRERTQDYPSYSQNTSFTCQKNLSTINDAFSLSGSGYSRISNTVSAMKTSLRSSTVSIAMYSSDSIWSTYNDSRPISTSDTCRSDTINHALQAVGYGTWTGTGGPYEYVIVKNSWGKNWGGNGYVRIQLTESPGVCGSLLQNYVAVLN